MVPPHLLWMSIVESRYYHIPAPISPSRHSTSSSAGTIIDLLVPPLPPQQRCFKCTLCNPPPSPLTSFSLLYNSPMVSLSMVRQSLHWSSVDGEPRCEREKRDTAERKERMAQPLARSRELISVPSLVPLLSSTRHISIGRPHFSDAFSAAHLLGRWHGEEKEAKERSANGSRARLGRARFPILLLVTSGCCFRLSHPRMLV